MHTVQHFEIPVDNTERALKFYKDIFEWNMQKWENPDDSSQEYWMFETTDENENKDISDGLMKRQNPQQTVTNYITV